MQNHRQNNETKKFPSSLFPCNRKTEPYREDYLWFHQQRTKLFVFYRSSGNREFHPFVDRNSSWVKITLNRKFLSNPFLYAFGYTPFSVTRARTRPLIDKQGIYLSLFSEIANCLHRTC